MNWRAIKNSISLHSIIAAASVAVGFGLILRLLHVNGLWIDEIYSLSSIRLPFSEMVMERLGRGHFPLYFSLLRGTVALLGGAGTEFNLRFLSILCWALAVISFVPLALRFLRTDDAAIAITLFAMNGLGLRQSVEARMYTLLLFEAVWVTRAHLELVTGSPKLRWRILIIIGSVSAFLTSSAFVFPAIVFVYDAWRRRKTASPLLRTWLIALVLTFILLLPGIILHMQTRRHEEIAGCRPINLLLHLATLLSGIAGNDDYYRSSTPLLICQIIGGILAAALLWRLVRIRRTLPPALTTSAWVALAPVILMGITRAIYDLTRLEVSLLGPQRYLIGTLPCAALLAAYLFGNLCECLHARKYAAHLLLALFLVVGSYAILTVRVEPFREVTQRLAQWYAQGDGLIIVPHQLREAVEYYLPQAHVDVAVNRWLTDEQQLAQLYRPLEQRKRVWLLWYRGFSPEPVDEAEKLFGPVIPEYSSNRRLGSFPRLFLFQPAGRTP